MTAMSARAGTWNAYHLFDEGGRPRSSWQDVVVCPADEAAARMSQGFTVEVVELGVLDNDEFDGLNFDAPERDGFLLDAGAMQAVAAGPFSIGQASRAVDGLMAEAGFPGRVVHRTGREFFEVQEQQCGPR